MPNPISVLFAITRDYEPGIEETAR
jgi:hypothetical protein